MDEKDLNYLTLLAANPNYSAVILSKLQEEERTTAATIARALTGEDQDPNPEVAATAELIRSWVNQDRDKVRQLAAGQ